MTFDGEVCVREVDLPPGVCGAIRESPDGVMNIYISSRLTFEEKRKTYRHEMRHFRLGHIGSLKLVRQMEKEANEAI